MATQCETTMKGMWVCSTRRLWFVGASWKVNWCVLCEFVWFCVCWGDATGTLEQGKSLPRCHGQNWTRLKHCESRELWTTSISGVVLSWPCWSLGLEAQWQGWLSPALFWKPRSQQVKPPFAFSSSSYLLSLQGEWTQKTVRFWEEHFNHELSIVPEQCRNVQMPIFVFWGKVREEVLHLHCTAGWFWVQVPISASLEDSAVPSQGMASVPRQRWSRGCHGLHSWSTHVQPLVSNKSTELFTTSHRWVSPLWRSLQTCEIRMTCLEFFLSSPLLKKFRQMQVGSSFKDSNLPILHNNFQLH